MTDETFFEEFENGTLSPELFHHKDHVKMVWLYLKKYDLLESLAKFSQSLKNFAKINGAEQRYHETITFAYVLIINERLKQSENTYTWEEFAERNSDLLDWTSNILKKYYREDTLNSAFAKKTFVFPDKLDN
jgi:hypothetical protein